MNYEPISEIHRLVSWSFIIDFENNLNNYPNLNNSKLNIYDSQIAVVRSSDSKIQT